MWVLIKNAGESEFLCSNYSSQIPNTTDIQEVGSVGAADANNINPYILDKCVNSRSEMLGNEEHNAEHCKWINHVETELNNEWKDNEEGSPRMHHLSHNAEDAVHEMDSKELKERGRHGRLELAQSTQKGTAKRTK